MSSQGPLSPTLAANTTVTGVAWDTPANAKASDGSFTSATTGDPVSATDALDVTGFGFTLPVGATVVGVLVEVQAQEAGGLIRSHTAQLLSGGITIGNNKGDAQEWPASEVYLPFGGVSDLWGASLTRAIVNASNFGVRVRADVVEPDAVALIDHVRLTVYYTTASGRGGNSGLSGLSGLA